ncbi:MAG: SPOR domain-containing protein [Pelobacteraceae bacterium]
MDFKFSKDSGDSQPQEAPGEKKKQSALLVLLLILVGGFTYLYFFTGLIKTQEVPKTAETPAPAAQIVKIPLPAREGETAKPVGKTPEKAEEPKPASSASVVAAIPAGKPVAAPPKAAPAPVQAAKPAQAPAKPKEEPKKPEVAKSSDKKPLPAPGADKKGEKAAAVKSDVKKPAATEKKSTPDKKKPVSDMPAKPETAAKVKKAAPESWSLIVGNYVLEEALSADMGRVRKAGLEPIVKPSVRKKTAMNRLFISESTDRATAQSTLEKLKRLTSDAFVIEQGGRYAVYAGSYLQTEAATSEKERLKAAGYTVTIKHTDIAIPSQTLSAGPFKSKKAAVAALGKLKSAGLKATLAQK